MPSNGEKLDNFWSILTSLSLNKNGFCHFYIEAFMHYTPTLISYLQGTFSHFTINYILYDSRAPGMWVPHIIHYIYIQSKHLLFYTDSPFEMDFFCAMIFKIKSCSLANKTIYQIYEYDLKFILRSCWP